MHKNVTTNTPQDASAIANSMERADYNVKAQVRTSRFRCEEVDGAAVSFDPKVLPFFVRHAASQNTHFMVMTLQEPAEI